MAESTGSKNKRTLDAFADDLDAMLNISDEPDQQVGEIDDDEVIDRLLVGDEAFEREAQPDLDEFADIDSLLGADEPAPKRNPLADIDEFGDEFDEDVADIPINPSFEHQVPEDEFADIVVDVENLQDSKELVEDDIFDDITALKQVGAVDEFAQDQPVLAVNPDELLGDELENMTEIDEFSEESESVGNTADFLMADFDISADDDFTAKPESVAPIDELAGEDLPWQDPGLLAAEAVSVEPTAIETEPAMDEVLLSVADDEPETEIIAQPVEPEPESQPVAPPPAPAPTPVVDYSGDITALTRQIGELKRQQQQLKHELADKPEKAELGACLDSVESLQVEQKKTKRGLDALAAKKPLAAYVANGIAALALLLGTGLGIQGMIAKSQVGELVAIIGKLQEQVNAAPANDAAEMTMLRKQLDELTVGSGVMSSQIAELTKSLQGNGGTASAGGDQSKQFAELSNQNMQIGAAIEALQNKVSALEKGRIVAAAPVPKPEKKKPEPVEENWAVNLIAYKQDWYAKSKAQEFAGKGVPAKVSKTESKGENWYRLSVDGFKSQYEAAAYAARVKKTLNLDSVWVTRNKD